MTPPRPEALEIRPRHIPQALKEVRGWVMWRWYLKGGKWTKPPLNIDGVNIDITNPDNWCDFTTALQAYQRGQFDGIGFSLGAMDSLGGADLDHCIQGGKIEPWALEIIEELGGYAEISPSGSGVRVFGLTPRVVEGRKKDNIEMYVDGRYLTVTGHKLDNSASDLVDFGEAFGAVYDRVFSPSPDSSEPEDFERGEVGVDLAERFQAFIDDDPAFKDRFNSPAAVGDRSGHEFHLCARLWEMGFTFDEIWQLMDSSPQTKWRSREDGYKERTIRKAITAARSSEKDRGRGEISTEGARDFIETVKEGLKADPRKLKDRAVLAALLALREKDPLEFDLLTDELKGAGVVKLPTLKKMIDGEERRQADEKAREEEEGGEDGPEVSEEIKKKAREILETGDPIKARCDYVSRTVEGNTGVAKAFIYSCSSAYMPVSDKLHADAVGASQGGKSVTVGAVHSTYPPENLEILTEASPKSVYYLAKRYEDEGRSFDDVILYINDARVEHIPVLKVFRDDGPGAPRNLTVVDGESLDLTVPGRPIVQSSSVLPLRDDEGQAVSRSFLATVADVDEAGEKKVRGKIRHGLQYGALRMPEADTQKAVLQQMGRILRDEGIRDVVVPFDAPEPSSADRRGTGQFIRLIKISAHENQFQRPILEMNDGRRFVIATYADLQNAAELWFEFEEAQAFKINHKVLKVFKSLPTTEPDHYNFTEDSPSKNRIAKDTGISPKSVGRYLSDLYDAGLIYRKKAGAPGNPHVFWTTDQLRQKVMSQISATGDGEGELGQIETKNGCPKYLGKNCPDSLKDSSKAFFTNQDIIKKENVKRVSGISARRAWSVSGGDILSSLDFLANRVLNAPFDSADSDYLRHCVLSQMSEMPPAIGSNFEEGLSGEEEDVSKDDEPPSADPPEAADGLGVAGDEEDGASDDYQSIAENLEEDKRRKAEIAERVKTPEEDRLPTAEESEVLEDLAGRILENWPGLPEMLLWEKARGKLGSRLPLVVVRYWLSESGYIETGEKYGGGVIWNLPTSGGVVE